ncbi:hypothetical protein D3C78_904960 [compost metagenome]
MLILLDVRVTEIKPTEQGQRHEGQNGQHRTARPERHALVHGLFIAHVEGLTLGRAAVVLVNLRLVGAVRLTNDQLGRDAFASRATLVDLDAEAVGLADLFQLGHKEAVRDELAHPRRQVGHVLGDQDDLHGVALGIDAVAVLLEPLQIADMSAVDLLPARPATPTFVDHSHRTVRDQRRKVRIVQSIKGQLRDATAEHLNQ